MANEKSAATFSYEQVHALLRIIEAATKQPTMHVHVRGKAFIDAYDKLRKMRDRMKSDREKAAAMKIS